MSKIVEVVAVNSVIRSVAVMFAVRVGAVAIMETSCGSPPMSAIHCSIRGLSLCFRQRHWRQERIVVENWVSVEVYVNGVFDECYK